MLFTRTEDEELDDESYDDEYDNNVEEDHHS